MASEHQATGDQRSVRRVPRELLDDLRSRVIHYVSEAKNFSAEIHQIAGKPPQLVLFLDGNIAEVDYNTNSQVADDHEKTNIILVQNIPPSLDEEFLELFFESKKKKGGGPVKHIKLDKENHWAIVEFYEPEAVDVVLSKRPITMLDKTVDIQPYLPLLPRDKDLTSLDIQGLPSELTKDLLAAHLNSILSPATGLEEIHQADELSSAPDERVTETVSNIRELHLQYLQVSDFQMRMKAKFPNLSITIDPSSKKIDLDGHASEIEAAKSDLNAFVDSLSIHAVENVSKPQLEIIQSKQAIDYITKVLKSLKLVAVWEVKNGKLVSCCSQDSVMFCQRVILKSVKMKIVLTPPDSSVLYTSDLWREFVTNRDKKYSGLCKILPKQDKSCLSILATDNVVEEVASEVQMFLNEHAIVQQTMTTEEIKIDPKRKMKKQPEMQMIFDQALKELPKHFLHLESFTPVCSGYFLKGNPVLKYSEYELDYSALWFIIVLTGTTKGIHQLKEIVANKHKIKLF